VRLSRRSVRPTYNASNPLENIRHRTDAKYVMGGGKLDKAWPPAVPLESYDGVNADVRKSDTKATGVFETRRKPQSEGVR